MAPPSTAAGAPAAAADTTDVKKPQEPKPDEAPTANGETFRVGGSEG